MTILVWSLIVMAALGASFAVMLAYASKRFAVTKSPIEEKVYEVLPHINCGACGFGSCADYAGTIARGETPLDLCVPGGMEVAKAVGSIMGVEVKAREPKVAVCHCRGVGVKNRFAYNGIRDCRAAALVQGGPKECYWGCIGFGTCERVCPVGAITMNADNLPEVDGAKCIGCGDCARECPKNLYFVNPISHVIHVRCSSHDPGRIANQICKFSCIACHKCEKACPVEAFKVIENLAVLDYSKCKVIEACIPVCPHNVIASFKSQRKGRIPHEVLLEASA